MKTPAPVDVTRQVVQYLLRHPESRGFEIARHVDAASGVVYVVLHRLAAEGIVRRPWKWHGRVVQPDRAPHRIPADQVAAARCLLID
jgi:DNA-binding PadR family transcriptional regulator